MPDIQDPNSPSNTNEQVTGQPERPGPPPHVPGDWYWSEEPNIPISPEAPDDGRDITYMSDMRSSSDIQDDDKTSESVTPQPKNFQVTNSPTAGWVRFSIQGDVTPNERQRAQSYRVYFVPYSAGRTDPANPTKRTLGDPIAQQAAFYGGTWVINIDAAGRQNAYQADDNKFFGKQGWFFAVGVNRKGQEGRPTIAVPSP